MRKAIFLIMIISIIAILCLHPTLYTPEQWYPFVLAEHLNPDSPANMGKLVLDPPAGKHGFCKVKNGHFYFEDGTRAKFWGTNLCFNACFPTKEQAELIADRLAFFGFNAVRFTHMDFYFEPKGIFEDTCPNCKDTQMKKTTKLSERQLAKLDYFIYQLKLKGIYVDVNLLVRRHFTLADGVIDADKLDGGAKPVSLFDPKLIELQKQYARDLFTHYNPYTKLRYCDDPTIALVEITNENSLLAANRKTIPLFYRQELDAMKQLRLGNNTLIESYSEIQKNYFEEMIGFLKKELNIRIPVTGIGGIQSKQDITTQESSDYIDKHAYWDHPKFPNKLWDKYDFTLQNSSPLEDKNQGIIAKITDSQPSSKAYTISEWDHCYPNQYTYETPVFLAATAANKNWDGLFHFAFSHGWDIRPRMDFISNFFDSIANSQKLILCSAGSFSFLTSNEVKTSVSEGVFKVESAKILGISGFIKRKSFDFSSFMVNSNEDGSILIYSMDNKPIQESKKLILLTIGEIKNSGSGWENGRYNWGGPPTLLKKMNAEIKINLQGRFKIYELDPDGMRIRQIPVFLSRFSTKYSKSPWFEIISE